MTNKTWLEVALNGPWSRDRQPGIPVRLEDIAAEGVACARAAPGEARSALAQPG